MSIPTRFPTIAAAVLCLAATPAFAQSFESNGHAVEVRHGDLDLSQPAAQKELMRRVGNAASKVCHARDLGQAMTCRRQTLANVKAPISTAIARAQSKDRFADAGTASSITVGN